MRIFLDSDVIISSSISKSGAAYLVVHESKVKKSISNYSIDEIERVVERGSLNLKNLSAVISKDFDTIHLKENLKQIKKKYQSYVTDIDDVHVVAGAIKSNAKFLLTYNLKHYKPDKIKSELDILVTQPGKFLQYLRSINKFGS